jgi:hypothetical protein
MNILIKKQKEIYVIKHIKIQYEKKNEIKADHFWNDTISNYATNVEHFICQTERKINSGNIWKYDMRRRMK